MLVWIVNCSNYLLWVNDFNISICLDISGSYFASARLFKTQFNRLVSKHTQVNVFQVKHDVDNIFFDAFNSGKLVSCALNFESDDCTAADA